MTAATFASVARLPRYLLPAEGIYHVTARGVARSLISRDDDDRRLFLVLLAREVRRESWNCHVFCLMPNHYHLIVDTQLEKLSRGLHRLNAELAQSFNQRYKRSGHLFGDFRSSEIVGRLADHWQSLQKAVLILPSVLIIAALFWLALAMKTSNATRAGRH